MVRIWDAATGKSLHEFEGHANGVNGLCWDPDGKRVASAGEDGTIRIWAVDGGQTEILKPDEDMAEKPLNVVAWRKGKDELVVGATDGTLSAWSRRNEKHWGATSLTKDVSLGAPQSICCDCGRNVDVASCHSDASIVIFDHNRVTRVILDGSGKVWESLAEKKPGSFRGAIITPSYRDSCTGMDVNPEGTHLAAACNGDLDIWQIDYNKLNVRTQIIPGLPGLDGYRAAHWSPDGKYLAAGDGSGRVVAWDVADGKVRMQRFQSISPKAVVAVAWEPGEGHQLAAACEDGMVRVWDADAKAVTGPFLGVDGIIEEAKTFVEEESWENMARVVALLRSQVLTPTQKLTLDELQAELSAEADEILTEIEVSPRVTEEERRELQGVIDLDPFGDAGSDALLMMEGEKPKINREKKKEVVHEPYAPVQATGPPNAKIGVLDPMAWAPAPRRLPAWLDLTFAKDVSPRRVEVHLTLNPQAAVKVTILVDRNPEQAIWPTNTPNRNNPLSIPVSLGALTTREVRVYVAGPCQIDAVCLIDEHGNKSWATKADASSSYSQK